MSPALLTKLLNLVLYQLGWFSCVLGAAHGLPLAGALGALLLVGVHLALARSRRVELLQIGLVCVLGVAVDSLQQAAGVFTFRPMPGWPLWVPPWVFVIWAQFATLFRYALYWLSGRYLLAALFGLCGGPLAYWAGIRLGAAEFGMASWAGLMVLGAVWAGLTPLLFWLSGRLNGGEGRYRGLDG